MRFTDTVLWLERLLLGLELELQPLGILHGWGGNHFGKALVHTLALGLLVVYQEKSERFRNAILIDLHPLLLCQSARALLVDAFQLLQVVDLKQDDDGGVDANEFGNVL